MLQQIFRTDGRQVRHIIPLFEAREVLHIIPRYESCQVRHILPRPEAHQVRHIIMVMELVTGYYTMEFYILGMSDTTYCHHLF